MLWNIIVNYEFEGRCTGSNACMDRDLKSLKLICKENFSKRVLFEFTNEHLKNTGQVTSIVMRLITYLARHRD